MPSDVRWQVRKAQCKTCMEEVPNGRGADGRLVWVVYRDGGEFGCRPNAVEAIAYATRKARAYGDGKTKRWRTLMDVPAEIMEVYDNRGRLWERESGDWVTYGSFIQRWSRAVTDLSGWGPFTTSPMRAGVSGV